MGERRSSAGNPRRKLARFQSFRQAQPRAAGNPLARVWAAPRASARLVKTACGDLMSTCLAPSCSRGLRPDPAGACTCFERRELADRLARARKAGRGGALGPRLIEEVERGCGAHSAAPLQRGALQPPAPSAFTLPPDGGTRLLFPVGAEEPASARSSGEVSMAAEKNMPSCSSPILDGGDGGGGGASAAERLGGCASEPCGHASKRGVVDGGSQVVGPKRARMRKLTVPQPEALLAAAPPPTVRYAD